MREKELRLALICYGGISLAVYMHGITKEIWRVLRASRSFHDGRPPEVGSETIYQELLASFSQNQSIKIRVFSDIIAGASAGGINGIFLAQAIASGQSLEPLANLWLRDADIEYLLDPDARPLRRFTKFWAIPLAWLATRKPGGTVEKTVAVEAREEVRSKLSQFVRARWFEPPFGGQVFSNLLLNALDEMAKSPTGPPLIPDDQPLDLIVTATDFRGHKERLRLNSPAEISENEHRLALTFRHDVKAGDRLGSAYDLCFAARATASFPGAFPPFSVVELDKVVKTRGGDWPERNQFLARISPKGLQKPEDLILIDGSVLANAPFRPAIEALRERPARREVDRRFVYIDPKPGTRAVRLTGKGDTALPGFFATILGAMSDIPREQPIRDNLEAIEGRSTRIRRMQRIIDAVSPDVEAAIQKLFGMTFFLNSPTPTRLSGWRVKAYDRAAADAGHAYASYGHIKLSGIVEELINTAQRVNPGLTGSVLDQFRHDVWAQTRKMGADAISSKSAGNDYFSDFDIRYRIRRLRMVARTVTSLIDEKGIEVDALLKVRNAVYAALAPFLDAEQSRFLIGLETVDAAKFLAQIKSRRNLRALDTQTDTMIATALAQCPKAERRRVLLSYLGFPFYDMATLPMLQGEGLDEFDPVKVDRIAPDDATSIRSGGASATLKGIEFNSFGAFFSRAYRENDYLWGRLHGAERLIDIMVSSVGSPIEPHIVAKSKYDAFLAILDEEEPRLTKIGPLFKELRREIISGPLAKAQPAA